MLLRNDKHMVVEQWGNPIGVVSATFDLSGIHEDYREHVAASLFGTIKLVICVPVTQEQCEEYIKHREKEDAARKARPWWKKLLG